MEPAITFLIGRVLLSLTYSNGFQNYLRIHDNSGSLILLRSTSSECYKQFAVEQKGNFRCKLNLISVKNG